MSFSLSFMDLKPIGDGSTVPAKDCKRLKEVFQFLISRTYQMLKYPFNDIERIPVINNNNNSLDWLWSRAAKIYSMRVRKYASLASETLRTRSV